MKFFTALFISKITHKLLRALGKPGTAFAGLVALKICPDFLSHTRKYINQDFINITGTNGKTTTSGIIAHILESNNKRVIHNLKGANMLTGIVNAFVLKLSPFREFDCAVIETDEAFLTKVYDYVKTDVLVVTNLFRDQLDRYGELDHTQKLIQQAIDKNPDLKIILNADDPMVAAFKTQNPPVYFGIDNIEYHCRYDEESHAPTEAINCRCHNPLSYSKRFYAQQGHYSCPACGFKRPDCKYSADVTLFDDCFEIRLRHDNTTDIFKINLVGLYNAYNTIAGISTALEQGMNAEEIRNALESYRSIFGRTESRLINGHKTLIQLIKNPAGASEVLKTVDLNSNIIIAINDDYADGRDISWLWDSDFEQLKNAQKLVVTSGVRAYDMAVRLKYAGIHQDKILVEPDVKKAIEYVTGNTNNDEKITILPSYTALLKISKY